MPWILEFTDFANTRKPISNISTFFKNQGILIKTHGSESRGLKKHKTRAR